MNLNDDQMTWLAKMNEANEMAKGWKALYDECRTEFLKSIPEDFHGDCLDGQGKPIASVIRGTRQQFNMAEFKEFHPKIHKSYLDTISTTKVELHIETGTEDAGT